MAITCSTDLAVLSRVAEHRQGPFRGTPIYGRAAKRGADHCLGRSRGGLTTKIHVVVDAQGLAIRFGLTAGQAHDGQIADTLLGHLGPHTIVLADKGYDADRIRELIQEQGASPNIPPKSNRRRKPCFSKRLYRERNLIERFFSKLKHIRRVATRYDKLAPIFSPWSSSPRCGCGCALMSLQLSTTLADFGD
jgi:transposase